MTKLVLLDGANLAYRVIHRVTESRTQGGAEVAGVLEFALELAGLLNRLKPTYFAVAWDTPRKGYVRRKLWSGYKANRPEVADEPVRYQLRWIKELVRASGVPCIEAEGWEADDVVATVLAKFTGVYTEAVIIARDKDYHQLVSSKVRVYDGEAWTDERVVRERWGVEPRNVVEVQTLAGDSSDAVPGIEGIGLKRAADLVKRYGSAEAAIDGATSLSPKMTGRFMEFDYKLGRALVELNKDVVVIEKGLRPNGPVHDVRQLAFDGLNYVTLTPVFEELGFTPWWRLEKIVDNPSKGDSVRDVTVPDVHPVPPLRSSSPVAG